MMLEVTLQETKVIVESDDSTVIRVMLSDGKTEKMAAFNYVPLDMFDLIDGINSCINKHENGEFVQGQRVIHERFGVGTVICKEYCGQYGVAFDDRVGMMHNCDGVSRVWGQAGTKNNCWWVHPSNITSVEKHKLQDTETFFANFQRYIAEK